MKFWCVFIALNLLSALACLAFVPADHRWNYALCRRDWFCRAARLSVHLIWITAALQWWLCPTKFPAWIRVVGAVLIIGGKTLVIWSRRVNPLFIPALIYVPAHLRVTEGPYRWIRHPGYLGYSLSAAGMFWLLGQSFAGAPMMIYCALITYRASLESIVLDHERC